MNHHKQLQLSLTLNRNLLLIERLPDHKRVETVMGIAKLEQVDGELINQIGELLKAKLNNMAFSAINKTDGLKQL